MNIKIFFKRLIMVVPAGLIFGCGVSSEYIPAKVIIPAHIKNIAVRPLENQTSQPGIGNKLWLAITDEFIRDGRLGYVDNEKLANGVILGRVSRYIETELSHDVNLVPLEYQLWVTIDIKFLDIEKNQYIWEEPILEQKLRYFVETEPGGKTVEEAREELWARFANDIVRRTIDGFGTVTGESSRRVPKEFPDIEPPKYDQSNPY